MLKQLSTAIEAIGSVLGLGSKPESTAPAGVPDEDRAIIERMESLRKECESSWQFSIDGRTIEKTWDDNVTQYLGQDVQQTSTPGTADKVEGGKLMARSSDGTIQFKLNRTQLAMVGDIAVQDPSSLKLRISPREVGDPTVWYMDPAVIDSAKYVQKQIESGQIAPTDEKGMRFVAAVGGLDADKIGGLAPIDAVEYRFLESAGVPKDHMIAVNDSVCADVVHTTFRAKWQAASGDAVRFYQVVNRSTFGHSWTRFQYNPDTYSLEFENLETKSVWCDPTRPLIQFMDWIQYDKVYPLEQAKRLWPDYAADMDTAKESGRLSEVFGAIYSNTDFGRDMVIVRTLYERNVVYPMTKKEALRYNAIVETVVPVVDPVTMQPTEMKALVYVDPLTGQPSGVPVTEAEFEDDGTPVNPSEKWPVISGVREIQALVNVPKVIVNRRCQYSDIPIIQNKNIPIPGNLPWGLGDPVRLADLQNVINRLGRYIVNILRFHAYPVAMMPESVMVALRKSGYNGSPMRPGLVVPVPDMMWMQYYQRGDPKVVAHMPQQVPEYINMLMTMLREFDTLSGYTSVMRGEAQYSGQSGAAINTLQQSAMGASMLKALHTQWADERTVKLCVDAMVKWMPPSEWARFNGKYARPVRDANGNTRYPVLDDIMSRLETFEANIESIVSAGRGAEQQRLAQLAFAAFQNKALPLEILHQFLGLVPDPRKVRNMVIEDQKDMIRASGEAQAELANAQAAQAKQQQEASASAKPTDRRGEPTPPPTA